LVLEYIVIVVNVCFVWIRKCLYKSTHWYVPVRVENTVYVHVLKLRNR